MHVDFVLFEEVLLEHVGRKILREAVGDLHALFHHVAERAGVLDSGSKVRGNGDTVGWTFG